jgi:hypothetical protein
MSPRAGLDNGEEKNLLPLPEIETQPSSPYFIIIPTELSQLIVLYLKKTNHILSDLRLLQR